MSVLLPPGLRKGDRVDHVLWLVRPENVQKAVDRLSETFRTSFDVADGKKRGFQYSAYVAWGAGLEVVTSYGDGPGIAGIFHKHLQEKGEGFWGVVYGVDDVQEAAAHCRSLGWDVGPLIQNTDATVRREGVKKWTSSLVDLQEIVIGEFMGINLVIGQIDYADQ